MKRCSISYAVVVLLFVIVLGAFVSNSVSRNNRFILKAGQTIEVCLDAETSPVVQSALQMFDQDVNSVLGCHIELGDNANASIVLSIDSTGKREEFRLFVNKEKQLQITGSDSHGLAYGILEVSRLLGVSPWCWWADVTPETKKKFELPIGFECTEAPDVAFRGIFINDEDWGLMPWSSKTYEPSPIKGNIGPETYSRVFELLLRLRANSIWPAMHECSQPFFLTAGNRETAKKYGIYVGSSHCEPMVSSTAVEWGRRGKGDYDYVNNSSEVYKFWEDRLKEVHNQEILYTVGMRGVHDGAMQGAGTIDEQRCVLERVISDQRKMLEHWVNPDITKVPQVFIPYKEVLNIYDSGLQVPEDVCLMWCDDNFGYIRHFPTETEKNRKGGNGIYYHVSYWGRPHDYLWLGSVSPYLMYHQLHKGYQRGICNMWILNVGDIKPSEYQIELFMDMAWNMGKVEEQGVFKHMQNFYSRDFGPELGSEMAKVMNEWFRLAYIRKPEHMGGTRVEEYDYKYWSDIHDIPWSRMEISQRIEEYRAISDKVEKMFLSVPGRLRDSFYELVKYPVQSAYQLNLKLLNAQLARHGKSEWSISTEALDSIKKMTVRYNTGFDNNGKWNRIMDCCPRNLPVFGEMTAEELPEEWPDGKDSARHYLNGVDVETGDILECEGLGYHQGAAELIPNQKVTYGQIPSNSELILHLVPTHPTEDNRLGLWVQIGDEPAQWIDYRIKDREEEWKQNVLRNQAIRNVKTLHGGNLTVWTDVENIVIDMMEVNSI